METAKDRENEFLIDLRKLLKKHHAELKITDDGKGYGWQTGIGVVTMDAIYDDGTDSYLKEFTEFELPTYMDWRRNNGR